MQPENLLQQQAAIARNQSQTQKVKHLQKPIPPTATIIGYNARTLQNIIQLSDGSISYAGSDTNGAIAFGETVPLHSGTMRVDGLPNIKKQPVVAKKAPLPKVTYPVKVLFVVYNEETGNNDVFIGGDRATPSLIYSTPNIVGVGQITNTGKNLNDWIATITISRYNSTDPNDVTYSVVIITSTDSYVFDETTIFYGSQFCGSGFIATKFPIVTTDENGEYETDDIRRGVRGSGSSLQEWYYREQITGVFNNNRYTVVTRIVEDPNFIASQNFVNQYSRVQSGSSTLTTPFPYSGTGSTAFSDNAISEYHIGNGNRFLIDNTTIENSNNRDKTQNAFSFAIYKDVESGNWIENQYTGIYTNTSSSSSYQYNTYTYDANGNVIDSTIDNNGNYNQNIDYTCKQFVLPNLLKDVYVQERNSNLNNNRIELRYPGLLLSTDMSQTLAIKAQIDYDFELAEGGENIIEDRSIYSFVTIDSAGTETNIPIIQEFSNEFLPNLFNNALGLANYIKEKNIITYINTFDDLFYNKFYECARKNIDYNIKEFTITGNVMTLKTKKVGIKSLKKPNSNIGILHASAYAP